MIKIYKSLLFLVIAFASSCIGEDFVDDTLFGTSRLSIITGNSIGQDTLNVGETVNYIARYTNAAGREQEVNFNWSSSRPQFASIDGKGKVIALSEGVTSIKVMAEGLTAERVIVVQKLERIEIEAATSVIIVGESITLSAKYFNQNGIETPASFNWESSDTLITTIDETGTVKAKKAGQIAIIAKANGIESKSFFLTVVDDINAVASVEIMANSQAISLGNSLQFTAKAKNVNGQEISAQAFNWSSSDPAVLTIDGNGKAESRSTGSSDITATANGINSAPYTVLVTPMITTSRSGSFQGSGSYSVSGNVTMSLQQNGSLRLDFVNFSSSSGPGLYVYLSNRTTNGIEIGKLLQTSGNFSVNVPANIGINDYKNVLIWCKPFGVTFGYASLN